MKRFLIVVAKSLTTTIIFFLIVELVLRGAYVARNAMVRDVRLPFALGDDHGPIPPWLDRLLILEPDAALIWRSLPHVRRTYVDIFRPIWTQEDQVRLLRRFAPTLPAAFRANPKWPIALNREGYRSAEFGRTPAPGEWTRVSPRDYESNVRAMVAAARAHNARVVLVDNELWEGSPYRPVLRRLARDEALPLVDSLQLVVAARTAIERDLEARLRLAPAAAKETASSGDVPSGATTVVFRVSRGASDVPRAISIVGTVPALGSLAPNTILVHDDGAHGDERAGDGVWSYAAAFAPGTRLFYVYTNSGAPGRWEGLDVPHIRSVEVPAAGREPVYLPIETFGRIYVQADDWHTNAVGYDLIARAVAQHVIDGR